MLNTVHAAWRAAAATALVIVLCKGRGVDEELVHEQDDLLVLLLCRLEPRLEPPELRFPDVAMPIHVGHDAIRRVKQQHAPLIGHGTLEAKLTDVALHEIETRKLEAESKKVSQ